MHKFIPDNSRASQPTQADFPPVPSSPAPYAIPLILVDATQCAGRLSVPKATFYKMVQEGLPAYRIGQRGRGLRFDMSEVLTWLRRHEVGK